MKRSKKMTSMPLFLPTGQLDRFLLRLRARKLCMLVPMTLLAACTSVPLPPWTPSAPRPAASAPASGPATEPATSPSAVQVFSVAPPATITTVSADQPAPYSEAVAARFPAPSVVYNTPGLQVGRTAFTTQAEIQTWLRDQAASASRKAGVKAAVLPIGRSQRDEALEALVLTRATGTDPTTLLATGLPTVLLVGQQHGDEPASSEALLVIARELAQGQLQPLLKDINVVIVPRANPDGAASEQRATAGGLDMNRDHLLLNTPEAQALAKLMRDYHPTVVVDTHEYPVAERFLQKFGTVQKFDALLQY